MNSLRLYIALLVTAFALSWSEPSHAHRLCQDAFSRIVVGPVFEASFKDPSCYTGGRCYQNIERFASKLSPALLERAEVLVIPNVRVYQVRTDPMSKIGKTEYVNEPDVDALWNFHVVLKVDRSIYDFDYRNEPTVVSTSNYFNKVLALKENDPEQPLTHNSRIYVFPATEYVRNIDEISRWIGTYFYRGDGNAPNLPYGANLSVREFLVSP